MSVPLADAGNLPEPLGAWDTRYPGNSWFGHFDEAIEWAACHISDPDSTYRAEFYLIDAPFAVLYRYRDNEQGSRYLDPATGEPATEEPVMQVLDDLPPRHLLGRDTQ